MYSIFGYVKNQAGQPIKNAKVYPYFKKVDSGSSDSKWTDTPYTTDGNGYYTFDLEDVQLLNVTGSYKKGSDKVYLAIVYNANDINAQDRDNLTFTDALFIEHVTIPSVDFYEMDLSIEPKRLPIVTSTTFPNADLLTKHNYQMAETSYADYSWKSLAPFTDHDISQKLMFDLVPIFDGHQLIDTIYSWDEIDPRNRNNNSSDTYQYDIAGDYNVCITVREKWNTKVVTCKDIRVKYNQPNIDFNWSPTETNTWDGSKIKGQELITFTNLSSDLDNRTKDSVKWGYETYYYKWTITDELQDGTDNTKVYEDKNWYYEPTHQFQSAGTKTITLVMYWNDGFVDKTETIVKTLEVHAYDIVPDFFWDKIPRHRDDAVTFDSTTTGDTDQIFQLDWVIDDMYPAPLTDVYTFASSETSIFNEGSPNNTTYVDNTYNLVDTVKPVVKFHSVGTKNIKLTLHYYNGWVNVIKVIEKTIDPVKYTTIPEFFASNYAPQGRFEKVTINNTTSYTRDTYDIGYGVDWRLDDFYLACNLDNDTEVVKDNYVEYLDVVKNYTVEHFYQNTSANNIQLEVRYDDGYQMITKRLTKVITPIVFIDPVPTFTWTPNVPVGRFSTVEIRNTTSYDETRCRGLDWTINDYYLICNLDNDLDTEKDNTKTYTRELPTYKPTHNFQSPVDHDIHMVYFFDDGFCEQSVELTKTITPEVFIPPVPEFSWTPEVPKGRHAMVTFTNDTNYDNIRSRNIDWFLSDHYETCNLDNDTDAVKDNSKEFISKKYDYRPTHFYQSPSEHSIQFDYYYDDGYCEQMVSKTQTITPIVYDPPIPNFTWDNTVPISREELVTFSNTTIDPDNRFRSYDWTIPDSYNLYNPDNPDYGVSVTDNTQTIVNELDKAYEPTHNFQDKISRDVEMVYHYDDGYCDRTVDITKQITFTEYVITPIIDTDIEPINNGFQGKIEINYFNVSTGDGISRQLEEKWKFNDRIFPTDASNVTTFTNTDINGYMPFTYQYPSRKPYTAIDNSTEQNINKNVWLEIRFDNGWIDTEKVNTNRNFEATPNEVSSLLTYTENALKYKH